MTKYFILFKMILADRGCTKRKTESYNESVGRSILQMFELPEKQHGVFV